MRMAGGKPRYRSMRYHVLKELELKLDQNLWYHGIHHTHDVLDVCNNYIRRLSLSDRDRLLLRTAAVLHDYGFITTYQDHEEVGCMAARDILPEYGYSSDLINQVCKLIQATKIPQSPSCTLCEILCDADLDYLGRTDFDSIAESLFKELKSKTKLDSRKEWNKIQYRFLNQHSFFTDFAQKYRAPQKQKNLEKIERWLKRYAPDCLAG